MGTQWTKWDQGVRKSICQTVRRRPPKLLHQNVRSREKEKTVLLPTTLLYTCASYIFVAICDLWTADNTWWHVLAKHLAKQVNTQSLVVEELAAVAFRRTLSAIPSSDSSHDTNIFNKPPTATCTKSNSKTRHLCCDVQGHVHMLTLTLATYYALSQNSTLKAGSIVIVQL